MEGTGIAPESRKKKGIYPSHLNASSRSKHHIIQPRERIIIAGNSQLKTTQLGAVFSEGGPGRASMNSERSEGTLGWISRTAIAGDRKYGITGRKVEGSLSGLSESPPELGVEI